MEGMTVSKAELLGLAIGTFAVATLSNIAANKLSEKNEEEKSKAMYFILIGVGLSFLLMTIFDKKIAI